MPDTFAVEPRTTVGKAVATLRRDGVLPANIFGRGLESRAVQIAAKDARALLHDHGANTLINLQVAGEPSPRSVVVRSVQRNPVSHELQHVDFYQVDLARRIHAQIPVVVIGEAPAVQTYKGLVLHGLDHVSVEALPAQMPTHLEVSIASISELEGEVTVADLVVPPGVVVTSPLDSMLARVVAQRGGEEGALPEGEQPTATPSEQATPAS